MVPTDGYCKINVDRAIAKTVNRGVVGAMCRAQDGMYLGALAVVFEAITHLGSLEALACHEALALATEQYIPIAVVASGCLEVVNGIMGKNLETFSHILHEIVVSTEERGGILFRHEGRSFNTEAHNLAQMATSLLVGRHVWLGNR
jgi:hypothetical protein